MDFPEDKHVSQLPMQDLAYIGDAVYELYMRQRCLEAYRLKPNKLNRIVIQFVNAKFQAEAAKNLEEILTEEESNILRRGRNASPGTKAKNASIVDYRMASALETLIGYVYLIQDFTRLEELLNRIFESKEIDESRI